MCLRIVNDFHLVGYCQLHHVHDLLYSFRDRTRSILRHKASIFNDSLVEEILCMKHQHVARNAYCLSHLLLTRIRKLSEEASRYFHVGFQWGEHLMVNRCVQSLEQSVCLFLLLQPLVHRNVLEVQDLALPLVEYQIYTLNNDSLVSFFGFTTSSSLSAFSFCQIRTHNV